MQEPMVLRFATAHPDGSICLILDEEDHDESDSIVLEYQPNRSPKWRRFEPEIRLEGVCSLPGADLELPRFIAMTEEGDTIDIIEGLPASRIPGVGYYAPDSLGRGDLITLKSVAGIPTAMGRCGQIYAMAPDRTFSPLSGGFPAFETPSDVTFTFLTGTYSPRQNLYYFVGDINIVRQKAASEAMGGEQFVELTVPRPPGNTGFVLTFDGSKWAHVRTSKKTAFNHAVTDAQGDVFIGEGNGKLYRFAQPDEAAPVLEVISHGGIVSLAAFNGQVLIAGNDGLYVTFADGPRDFEPALPIPDGDYIFELAASERRLYVFFDESISYLEDGEWHTLDVPPELAVLGVP